MTRSAARISVRLMAVLRGGDDGARPMTDIWREVCAAARELGVPSPSYERVRQLVHEDRSRRGQPGLGEVLVAVATRERPPDAVLKHVAGTGP